VLAPNVVRVPKHYWDCRCLVAKSTEAVSLLARDIMDESDD
jgi:hypothetical protein